MHYSVFGPQIKKNIISGQLEELPHTLNHGPPTTKEEFDATVSSVRRAISRGVHPSLIKQGSSGSYFAMNSQRKIIGVFKPKNEEPYGELNPKLMKWLHRTIFPCFFGRSCLIPNLSYISEAAACVLDRQLQTYIVPYTDVVWLSSKSFNYPYFDRRANYRKGKSLPAKLGSFQIFLDGFKDATVFLRENPWPDYTNHSFDTEAYRNRRVWTNCVSTESDVGDDDAPSNGNSQSEDGIRWTPVLQQKFREELEKLVILDYMMRNTDRGLNNWMIKICDESVQIVADPGSPIPSMAHTPHRSPSIHLHVGAIDNSLAFPIKHPDEWRSYPFGWLFLPVSLIGQPFSKRTRDHFLPLLTSTSWWAELTRKLRLLFSQDSDFQEKMFARQLSVLKGQAWNIVETLKQADQGPLELTRRDRVQVWDDEMDIPIAVPLISGARQPSYHDEMDLGILGHSMPSSSLTRNLPSPPAQDHSSPSSSLPEQSHTLTRPSKAQVTEPRSSMDEADLASRTSDEPIGPLTSYARDYFKASRSRISYEGPSRPQFNMDPQYGRRRGYSLSYKSGNPFADEDGDLGYTAAEDDERHRKKVIVERSVTDFLSQQC